MTLPGLEEILKAHEEALERARKIAEITAHSPEMLPELLREQKIAARDRLNRRIDRLVAERDRMADRFTAQIKQEREALARVEAEIAKLEPRKRSSKPRKKSR